MKVTSKIITPEVEADAELTVVVPLSTARAFRKFVGKFGHYKVLETGKFDSVDADRVYGLLCSIYRSLDELG